MLHIFAGPVGLSDDRWGRRALKKFEASSCREAYAASLKDCQYFDRFCNILSRIVNILKDFRIFSRIDNILTDFKISFHELPIF